MGVGEWGSRNYEQIVEVETLQEDARSGKLREKRGTASVQRNGENSLEGSKEIRI